MSWHYNLQIKAHEYIMPSGELGITVRDIDLFDYKSRPQIDFKHEIVEMSTAQALSNILANAKMQSRPSPSVKEP